MNAQDAEKLAATCWNATSDTPFAACTIDHQLRLSSVVNSIEEQLLLSKPPATNIAGLEKFEAEVIHQLTALVPAVTGVVTGESAEEDSDKKAKKVAKKK